MPEPEARLGQQLGPRPRTFKHPAGVVAQVEHVTRYAVLLARLDRFLVWRAGAQEGMQTMR